MSKEPCPYCARPYQAGHGLKVHMARCSERGSKVKTAEPIEEFQDVPEMSDVSMLKLEVEMEADRNGHELGLWQEHVGWSSVKCSGCGATGTASTAPRAGNPRADTRELVKPCK